MLMSCFGVHASNVKCFEHSFGFKTFISTFTLSGLFDDAGLYACVFVSCGPGRLADVVNNFICDDLFDDHNHAWLQPSTCLRESKARAQ